MTMTRILVIDDSPTEMARFREVLTKNNLTILEATNGEQGIRMAIDQQPDLVLMDVVMPEMNGFQATRKIARNKATSHIPVVIVSTKNQETDRVWGKRQGAKEYLTKPINEIELLKVIERMKPIDGSQIGSPLRQSQQPVQQQAQKIQQQAQTANQQARVQATAQQTRQVVNGSVRQQPQAQVRQAEQRKAAVEISIQPVVTPRPMPSPAQIQTNLKPDDSDDNGIYL